MFIVVKISGGLLNPLRVEYLKALRDTLLEARRYAGLAIVMGGGPVARDYIKVLRALNIPETLLDIVGIRFSQINALALALALNPHSPPKAVESIEEAVEISLKGLIPVLGGLQPGQSTNAVAVALAEALRADLMVNMLSDIDGVYMPPPGFEGSRRLDVIGYKELESIIRGYPQIAGTYELFDHVALKLAERGKVKVLFVNGSNPRIIMDIVRGEKVIGTMLT